MLRPSLQPFTQRERQRERERERERDLAIVCAVRKRDGLSKRRNRWTRTGKVDWKGTRNSRRKRENADWTREGASAQIDCGKKTEKVLKRRREKNWQTRNRTIKLRTKRRQTNDQLTRPYTTDELCHSISLSPSRFPPIDFAKSRAARSLRTRSFK